LVCAPERVMAPAITLPLAPDRIAARAAESQWGAAMQSASVNASTFPCEATIPALRAADGPGTAAWSIVTPGHVAGAMLLSQPFTTTMVSTGKSTFCAEIDLRHATIDSGQPWQGTITLTDSRRAVENIWNDTY
jgi:hypothetical protein